MSKSVQARLEALEGAHGENGCYHIVHDEDIELLDRGALNPKSSVSIVTFSDTEYLFNAVKDKLKAISGRRNFDRDITHIHFELPRFNTQNKYHKEDC